DGDHDHRSSARQCSDVRRALVHDRHRRILVQQQRRGWTTNDGAAPDDDDIRTTERYLVELQKLDDRFRGRWDETRTTIEQQANVVRVNALNVLRRRDVVHEIALVELSREWRQKQDAVGRRIATRAFQLGDDRGFGRVASERDFAHNDPEALAAAREALQIRVRGRIDANGDSGQRRVDAAALQSVGSFLRARVQPLRERSPVQQSHQRAMRVSTKSVIRLRCASAPSSARSRSSDSAFTCAGSFTEARLIITFSDAPRSAASAMSAPTPISLAVAAVALAIPRSHASSSRRLVFATSSGTRDAASKADWIRSVRSRFSSSFDFGSFIASATPLYAALSSSTRRRKSARRFSISAT